MTYGNSYEEKKRMSKNVRLSPRVNGTVKNNNSKRTKAVNDSIRMLARQKVESHALEEKNIKVVAAVKDLPKVRTIKAKKNMPFPTSVVFVSVICTVLFMFMMLTMAQINEFTQDISALQNELSDLTKREEELKLDVELKNDLRIIEDAAVNELGMVKSDEVKKQYLIIGKEDRIEVVEPESKDDSLINTVMSSIGENFRELLEYIN